MLVIAIAALVVFWIEMFAMGYAVGAEKPYWISWICLLWVLGIAFVFANMFVSPEGYNFSKLTIQDVGALGILTIGFLASSLGSGYLIGRTRR